MKQSDINLYFDTTSKGYGRMKKEYCVVQYVNDQFDGVISGLGRNKGKLEAMHTRRTANKYAKQLNQENTIECVVFKVETDH